jgi:hypothetical protein
MYSIQKMFTMALNNHVLPVPRNCAMLEEILCLTHWTKNDVTMAMQDIVWYHNADLIMEWYKHGTLFQAFINDQAQRDTEHWPSLADSDARRHVERIVENLALLQPILPLTPTDQQRLRVLKRYAQRDKAAVILSKDRAIAKIDALLQ